MARFEQLLELQPYIAQMEEHWAAIRRGAGLEAAEEIVRNEAPKEGNIEAAWQRRWQDWSPFALAEREDLKRQTAASMARSQFERTSRAGPMSDVIVIALDLRYVGGLPLARIADLLNVSPTAIQLRLADFERDVAGRIARQSILRQLPVGYNLDLIDTSAFFLEPPPSEAKRRRFEDSLVIEIVSAWEDVEIPTGRLKEVPASRWRRNLKFEPANIAWAVVLAPGPSVLFLSGQDLSRRGGTRTTTARIIGTALELGHETLSSVMPSHWGQTTQAQLESGTQPDKEEV